MTSLRRPSELRRGERWRAPAIAAISLMALLPVTACGSDGAAGSVEEPTREYSVRLRAEDDEVTYTYIAEDALDLRVGDRVTFEMENAGTLAHDLAVIDADGNAVAVADPVRAGASLQLVVQFEEPGYYRLRCNVDDHLTVHDMQVLVEVKNADGTSAV